MTECPHGESIVEACGTCCPEEGRPEEGRIRPPYGGVTHCVNSDCREPLGEEHGVYMHTNRENGKIIMFCGPCSRKAQMFDGLRFPLVAL